ncbi:MAG: HAD-IIA family hydrolase [Herpetosiphon sp.]
MTLDLSTIRTVLFDMDGVLYRGETPLPGVNDLWHYLDSIGVAYVCVTNNATLTPEQFSAKLKRMGLQAAPDHIFSSANATARWLRDRHPAGTTIYAVGMDGLRSALFEDGYFVEQPDQPQIVVVGADFEVTYAKLRIACLAIRDGALFVGTNPDKTFPGEQGIVPGCGALLAALAAATDQAPLVIGKPEPAMFEAVLLALGADPRTTLMVGDRLDTDIAGAQRVGLPTALVLTGVSSAAEARTFVPAPDAIFADLPAMLANWQL